MKLEEIKALIEAATPGPWVVTRNTERDFGGAVLEDYGPSWIPGVIEYGSCGSHQPEWREEDAAFVAAARDLLPKLLKVAEAAKAFTKVEQLEPWDKEAEGAFKAVENALRDLES